MISIIVPVYNVEAYLSQCLDSLINQTYQDLEIICVNDGSTDGSLQILYRYQSKDKRIKVFNQKNQGLSGARNTGITQATGDWMMFVDSDDWLDLGCCKRLMQIVDSDLDLCFFSYTREFGDKVAPKLIFGNEIINYQAKKDVDALYARLIGLRNAELMHPEKLDSLSTAWGKLYKASIIKEHQIEFVSTKEIGTEDLLFNIYYFRWIKKAMYIPNTFYHYRKNNITSLTRLYKPNLVVQWTHMFRKIEGFIKPLDRDDLLDALLNRKALCLIGLGLNIVFSDKSLKEKYILIDSVVSSDWYRHAIENLPLNYFPLHWKLFYFSAKKRIICLLLLMLYYMKVQIYR
jgi:glycosyltransferase EpsH